MSRKDVREIRVTADGPLLVDGPIRITLPDGSVVDSDRFAVAICTCRRSKIYPLCDASHRRKERKKLSHKQLPDDTSNGQISDHPNPTSQVEESQIVLETRTPSTP